MDYLEQNMDWLRQQLEPLEKGAACKVTGNGLLGEGAEVATCWCASRHAAARMDGFVGAQVLWWCCLA